MTNENLIIPKKETFTWLQPGTWRKPCIVHVTMVANARQPLFGALAHDGKLKKGETRMLVVTHYHERCWPPTWELDWVEERNELPLPAIKDRLKEIHRIIDEDVKEKYKDEVWKDQFWGGIYSIEYNWKRSWKETKEVLKYFKNHD